MFQKPVQAANIDHVWDLSYYDFFNNYMLQNKPCIISCKSIQNWKSCKKWVTACNEPDFNYLEKKFGTADVPVSDCKIREYNSQRKLNMKMNEYLKYWKEQSMSEKAPCLYLKDWHFCRDFPEYNAYDVPIYFKSDWLNEYCKFENDDYKFVYMGPKGTWTPLHVDVFGSYSWSANICGRKKWVLFPSGTERCLHNDKKELVYNINELSPSSECFSVCLEVIQHPGEIIFVPSGWHHQVLNLDNCISINHNWFNGCNILHIWNILTIEAGRVTKEIADCNDTDEWEQLCEVLLKAHHGMNYEDFLKTLNYIGVTRLNQSLKTWHDDFDIAQICEILNRIKSSTYVSAIVKTKAQELYQKLQLRLLCER